LEVAARFDIHQGASACGQHRSYGELGQAARGVVSTCWRRLVAACPTSPQLLVGRVARMLEAAVLPTGYYEFLFLGRREETRELTASDGALADVRPGG
jgi:hypothetical protein